MRKALFNDCCFCINLRWGCLLIGYSQLVTAFVANLLCLSLIIEYIMILYSPCETPFQLFSDIMFGVEIFYVLIFTSFMIFNIILLVGVHRNKPRLVMAYLVYKELFLVVSFILLIADAIVFTNLSDIMLRMMLILIGIYFLHVVQSHHCVMLETSAEATKPTP